MDSQDRLLREALEPEPGAVIRIVATASDLVRGGRTAASTPHASGRSKSGGSGLRRAAPKPPLERYGVRRLAAGVMALTSLGVGFWLSIHPRSPEPVLMITNQGSVYVLRDRNGTALLRGGEALAEVSLRGGNAMFMVHGGVR